VSTGDRTATTPEMAKLRRDTLRQLEEQMPPSELAGARECARRLHATLPNRRLDENVVLVAYGGGKDSSYTLAFVRAVQLILFARHGGTFRLRTVTNRHAGMPRAVMENIDRVYRALRMLDDRAGCQALLVDGSTVKPYRVDEPLGDLVERNRLDLLMTGHRTGGEARPTFCNACNLSMVNSFGLAAAHDGGVDVIITGDSPEEQRSYYLWVHQLARRFGGWSAGEEGGFRGFLRTTNTIAGAYFSDIYGPGGDTDVQDRRVAHDVGRDLAFFSIFADTPYASVMHWEFLTEFLGFQFDEIAFSFTESDCGNPTLMAHLRGLRCERLYGRGYDEGLAEYLAFAESLMRRKEFPERLIDAVRRRYRGDGAAERMRELANRFAHEAYGLTEEQLVCMLYSPFTDKGQRLQRYLAREQPQLVDEVESIHALLTGDSTSDGSLADTIHRITGLALSRVRTLYFSPYIQPSPTDRGTLLNAILAGDPHRATITTRHAPDGPDVTDLVSGR
jgi:hypothetical protein